LPTRLAPLSCAISRVPMPKRCQFRGSSTTSEFADKRASTTVDVRTLTGTTRGDAIHSPKRLRNCKCKCQVRPYPHVITMYPDLNQLATHWGETKKHDLHSQCDKAFMDRNGLIHLNDVPQNVVMQPAIAKPPSLCNQRFERKLASRNRPSSRPMTKCYDKTYEENRP
jgi:hypothetical protein